jgi:flagellar export protein FliJ
MRRFRFRLETVLNHRKTIETLREQDFAGAQGQLQAIEARIAALREEFRQTVAGRPGGVTGERLNAPAILDRERYLETLLAAVAQQERRADAVRVQVEEKRQALVAARQAREAVSRLRDKDLIAHVALGHKLEQDALDELATLRHIRAMTGHRPDAAPLPHAKKEAA